MNELLSMRAYVKVVEVGSFTEAARQISTTKSVIINRVNQLEEHLQIELLHRSTRKLTLTDTGLDYYQRCIRLLSDLDEAKSAVSSIEWGLTGTFRVSCISSFASAYLADEICNYRLEHPELNIEFQVHDRFCDPVQEGFDVSLQPTDLKRDILEKVNILPMRRIIVATSEYLEKYGMPKSPNEIKNHHFAHNNHVEPENIIRFLGKRKITAVRFKPVISTNTVWLLRSAVLQGQCMAMMPIFFIERELISGELIPVLPKIRIQHAVLSAYYRKTAFVPMKVKVFLNDMKRKYGEYPPWERRLAEHRPELKKVLGPDTNNS